MASIILTVRPEPDCDLDVGALARRGVPALAAPLMIPRYDAHRDDAAAAADLCQQGGAVYGGVIFTSRHAVTGFVRACGGALDAGWHDLPVFAVGRSTGRAAAVAGFRDVTIGTGGGAGLVPLITARAATFSGPLLWPAARDRSFDMVAALAPVANVRMAEIYAMMPAPGLADAAQTAIADGDVLGVVLMSARSAQLFQDQLIAAGHGAARRGIVVIAGSRAIADAAGDGWRRVYVARRPTRARLLAIAALLYDRRDRL